MYLSTKPDDCKHDSGVSDEDISDNCDDKSEVSRDDAQKPYPKRAALTGHGLEQVVE